MFRAGIEKVTPHVEPRTVPSYVSSDPEMLPSEKVISYKNTCNIYYKKIAFNLQFVLIKFLLY